MLRGNPQNTTPPAFRSLEDLDGVVPWSVVPPVAPLSLSLGSRCSKSYRSAPSALTRGDIVFYDDVAVLSGTR